MPAFYYAKAGLFGGGPKKGQRGRKFFAKDVAHAQEKIQRLSDKTGKRFNLWYAKDLVSNPSVRKSKKSARKMGATFSYKGFGGGKKSKKAKTRRRSNPLPIGKAVRVKAIRRPDGKIDLYR